MARNYKLKPTDKLDPGMVRDLAKPVQTNGKGDGTRPMSVSYEEYAANWDRIFAKGKKRKK